MPSDFDVLMEAVSDPAFWDAHEKTMEGIEIPGADTLDPAIYLACFGTPTGRAVLKDLHRRFINVTRFYPGEPEGSGFFREGAASVVFDIAVKCEQAAQGHDTSDTAEG